MTWTMHFLFLILSVTVSTTTCATESQSSSNICNCPHIHSDSLPSSVHNAVILSVTGRVGSSNLLSMLGSHPQIKDLGEIFISSMFHSKKLPPNYNSPIKSPASSAMKQRLMSHIKKSFLPSNEVPKVHRLASIKFWHAWENGVNVMWMVKRLQMCGCVTHFILIARNPVRITISEQYANRFHAWSYFENKETTGKKKKNAVCEKSMLSHHVGGRWLGEMVVDHYSGFHEVELALSSESRPSSAFNMSSGKYLGLSYEADILTAPRVAYQRIAEYLKLSQKQLPSTRHKKGMSCPLSMLLVNLEELRCSLHRWERKNLPDGLETKGLKIDDPDLGRVSPVNYCKGLQWMAADVDERDMTFECIMESWRGVHTKLGRILGDGISSYSGHVSECSLTDIVRLQQQSPGLLASADTSTDSWKSRPVQGMCGVGGETARCHGVPAVPADQPALCLLSAQRTGCDGMTFKDGHCYLHKNITGFRVEACSQGSWYQGLV